MSGGKAPYLDKVEPGKPIVAARVAYPEGYPETGKYWAKADETCQKIAKMFNVDLEILVTINKSRWPALLSVSKLKKDTMIELPPCEVRWILTKQIGKNKPEGKKKRVYSVQDIEPPYQIYENIESFRVQEYPQTNSYSPHEIVCALYPNEDILEGDEHASSKWLTAFYPAIFLYHIHNSTPPKAMLKFKNNAGTLDHKDGAFEKPVLLSVIIKREKIRRRGGEDDDEGPGVDTSEIHIFDPKYTELGKRLFLWDSMTEYWHDSLDRQRKIRFKSRTTRQATQSQPLLLAADAPFAAALEAVPAEDWCRTWAAGRTIMLRRTSKRVKEVVDKMRLPAVVRLSRSFWDDARNGTAQAKRQFVMRQLALMTGWCRISTLELSWCDMRGQDVERLAGVLVQCPALAHLDLGGNFDFGAAGAEMLAGVLGQCRELVHLDLCGNYIEAGGAERLAGVLAQCPALAHLNLSYNHIGPAGTEFLAGVLAQCAALAHLDLSGYNEIGAGGAERLAGVLAQCPALAYLDLSGENEIGTVAEDRLRASWRGRACDLVLGDDDEEDEEDEDDEENMDDDEEDDEDEDGEEDDDDEEDEEDEEHEEDEDEEGGSVSTSRYLMRALYGASWRGGLILEEFEMLDEDEDEEGEDDDDEEADGLDEHEDEDKV